MCQVIWLLFNDLNGDVVKTVLCEVSVYGSSCMAVQVVSMVPKSVSKVLACLSYVLLTASVARY